MIGFTAPLHARIALLEAELDSLERECAGYKQGLLAGVASKEPVECLACKAKDQSITLLADVVDWHRAQAAVASPFTSATQAAGPRLVGRDENRGQMWVSDDVEDITAALESGALSTDAAEKALAQIQAFTQTVEVVN